MITHIAELALAWGLVLAAVLWAVATEGPSDALDEDY